MPTEKEIEAALAAWDSIPRHKDLDGRQRMRAALEAAETVRNENLAAMAENIRQANAFAIAQWPCSDKEAANEVKRILGEGCEVQLSGIPGQRAGHENK